MILLIVCLFSYLLKTFLCNNFPNYYKISFFLFSLIWFFLSFPGNILSVRPDFLSFLFEFLAFASFYETTFKIGGNSKWFYLSAIFAGLAIATKLNTIGVFLGILLFLVIIKQSHKAFIYLIVSLSTVTTLFTYFYVQLGEKFVSNILGSIQKTPEVESGNELVSLLVARVQELVLSQFLFYLLVAIGLGIIFKEDRQKSRLFVCCLGTSFTVATIGQISPGAYLNYHFGFFMLAVIPASIGIYKIFNNCQREAILKPLKWILLFAVMVKLILALLFPAAILVNDLRNYPYKQAEMYIQESHPDGYIYITDSTGILYFFSRTLIGPWVESYLRLTPRYKKYVTAIKQELSKYHFSAAIMLGTGCEKWQPTGFFVDETQKLINLEKKFKKICIFGEG